MSFWLPEFEYNASPTLDDENFAAGVLGEAEFDWVVRDANKASHSVAMPTGSLPVLPPLPNRICKPTKQIVPPVVSAKGRKKVAPHQKRDYNWHRKKGELLDVILSNEKVALLDSFLGTERVELLNVLVNGDRSNLLDMLENPQQIEALSVALRVSARTHTEHKDEGLRKTAQKLEAENRQLRAQIEEERRVHAQERASLAPADCSVSQKVMANRINDLLQSFSGQVMEVLQVSTSEVTQTKPSRPTPKPVVITDFLACSAGKLQVPVQRATTFVYCKSFPKTPQEVFRKLEKKTARDVILTNEGVSRLYCVVELVNGDPSTEARNLLALAFPDMWHFNATLTQHLLRGMPCFKLEDDSKLERFFMHYVPFAM